MRDSIDLIQKVFAKISGLIGFVVLAKPNQTLDFGIGKVLWIELKAGRSLKLIKVKRQGVQMLPAKQSELCCSCFGFGLCSLIKERNNATRQFDVS